MTLHYSLIGQAISLFEQVNGRFDYIAIGNTMNPQENNGSAFCTLLEVSSAELDLNPDFNIVKAYLYWAGSGSGDQTVSLNGTEVLAENTYTVTYNSTPDEELVYFSAYTDITDLILTTGNGTYELTELDVNSVLLTNPGYCQNRTNFAGWSIYVIYEDAELPLNQISLFQGLEIINRNEQTLDILLNNINVLDNNGAKIGFLAWEGDNALNFGETLSINGNIISNPPLNLPDNAFNGTNTFTNSSTFYNADLDVYDIENNIAVGDTAVAISLTTGALDTNGILQADLIIINNIITVLNSRLPDATIEIEDATVFCNLNTVDVEYTIFNTNSTDVLPANTPIAFYANNLLVAQAETNTAIEIGSSETNTISMTIPENLGLDITIVASVDDIGNMTGIVAETDESNNLTSVEIQLNIVPVIPLNPLLACNEGFGRGTYNLFDALTAIDFTEEQVSFYLTLDDLNNQINAIPDPFSYTNVDVPEVIYARVERLVCFEIYEFQLLFENCPPHIPQGFSPNADTLNDWFNIRGLYDIFVDHRLRIYNRLGILVFEGDNNRKWNGEINRGLNGIGNIVPVGTYYYTLDLNDPSYRPMVGWVYVNY